MGNRGRSSDPNDTIRLLKSKVRSLEREIQRLRKANGRFTESADEAEQEPAEKVKKTKQAKVQEQTAPTCERCGSSDTTVMELPTREGIKIYITCYNCGSRKKTTKK